MTKYRLVTLKEIQNNPEFKRQNVLLEGVVRGLCYKPGNLISSTQFQGLLEQDNLILGFSGVDTFDKFYATRLLKASSETNLPIQLKGKLEGKPDQYELRASGVHYQGVDYRFKE